MLNIYTSLSLSSLSLRRRRRRPFFPVPTDNVINERERKKKDALLFTNV